MVFFARNKCHLRQPILQRHVVLFAESYRLYVPRHRRRRRDSDNCIGTGTLRWTNVLRQYWANYIETGPGIRFRVEGRSGR